FVLFAPHRLQNLHHEAGVDRVDGQIADYRIGVCRESIVPLLPMLGIAPAGFMRRHVARGAPFECHRLRLGNALCGLGSVSRLYRVEARQAGACAGARPPGALRRGLPSWSEPSPIWRSRPFLLNRKSQDLLIWPPLPSVTCK